ncbi:MAG: hypothetical protein Q3966_04200 [Neisseria sp.]|nr:hypothetical protein [Neisseria sp.]
MNPDIRPHIIARLKQLVDALAARDPAAFLRLLDGLENAWTEDYFYRQFDFILSECGDTDTYDDSPSQPDISAFDDGGGYLVEYTLSHGGRAGDWTLSLTVKTDGKTPPRFFLNDLHIM